MSAINRLMVVLVCGGVFLLGSGPLAVGNTARIVSSSVGVGDDLPECKNFGVTSLNEVHEKLTVMGLKLCGD